MHSGVTVRIYQLYPSLFNCFVILLIRGEGEDRGRPGWKGERDIHKQSISHPVRGSGRFVAVGFGADGNMLIQSPGTEIGQDKAVGVLALVVIGEGPAGYWRATRAGKFEAGVGVPDTKVEVRRREIRKRKNGMVFILRVALCWCIWSFLFDVDFVEIRVRSLVVGVQVAV